MNLGCLFLMGFDFLITRWLNTGRVFVNNNGKTREGLYDEGYGSE